MAAIVVVIGRGCADPAERSRTQIVHVNDAVVVIIVVFVVVTTSVLVSVGGFGGLPSFVGADARWTAVVDVLDAVSILVVTGALNDDLSGCCIARRCVSTAIRHRRNGVRLGGLGEVKQHLPDPIRIGSNGSFVSVCDGVGNVAGCDVGVFKAPFKPNQIWFIEENAVWYIENRRVFGGRGDHQGQDHRSHGRFECCDSCVGDDD